MTNKKFTDEEIKSSLEVIATTGNCNECKIRNCKWGTCNCSQITANAALDLINRPKTEPEKIKSEAIKEFAEKLKKRFYLCAGRCVVDVYHIDNLVKEMTEGKE